MCVWAGKGEPRASRLCCSWDCNAAVGTAMPSLPEQKGQRVPELLWQPGAAQPSSACGTLAQINHPGGNAGAVGRCWLCSKSSPVTLNIFISTVQRPPWGNEDASHEASRDQVWELGWDGEWPAQVTSQQCSLPSQHL